MENIIIEAEALNSFLQALHCLNLSLGRQEFTGRMSPHDSIPYNPDMANVFYKAGYIESWGRGIQKICDACASLGAPAPEYSVIGHNIRIKFKALFKVDGGLNGVKELT
ncbi:MAG: hypothetical protein J6U24_08185 [Paludibacteraceae bacterium]|nr:hypothetical protein [Paludibacteraceae bacterium]